MTKVDYLRLATWDFTTYTRLAAQIRAKFPGEWSGRHWLQYNGHQNPGHGIFYGSGDQGDRKHFVASASGTNAQIFFDFILAQSPITLAKLYCTRIDLQQTIAHPDIVLRKVFKACPRKTKTWIESDTDTLYIGARGSEAFTRLYQKLEKKWLRLEHEFKGHRARSIFLQAVQSGTPAKVLQSHFITATRRCKMGTWVQLYFDMRLDIIEVAVKSEIPEELELELGRKKRYLNNTEMALGKYLDDDDLCADTIAAIERLAVYARSKA